MNKPLSVLALCLASASMNAFAAVYELPADGSAVVGTDSRIRLSDQDKLFDVARRYGLGYPEIVRTNPGADIWLLSEGQEILLPVRRILPPTPHEGIVINLPEHGTTLGSGSPRVACSARTDSVGYQLGCRSSAIIRVAPSGECQSILPMLTGYVITTRLSLRPGFG